MVASWYVNEGFWMALQAGISIWWAFRFGGKFKSQICQVPKLTLLLGFLAGVIFASHGF